jgi:hypothetical protein
MVLMLNEFKIEFKLLEFISQMALAVASCLIFKYFFILK